MRHAACCILAVSAAAMSLAAACGGRAGSETSETPAPEADAPSSAELPPPVEVRQRPPVERPEPPPPAVTPPEPEEETSSTGGTVYGLVLNILDANCGSCHGRVDPPASPPGRLEFTYDIDRMLELGLIVPLSSETSPLVLVMLNGSMPPPALGLPISGPDIEGVRSFIDNPRFWPGFGLTEPESSSDSPSAAIDAGTDGG